MTIASSRCGLRPLLLVVLLLPCVHANDAPEIDFYAKSGMHQEQPQAVSRSSADITEGAVTPVATQTYTGDVIQMTIWPSGRPGVWAKASTGGAWVYQYFGTFSWASVFWLNGAPAFSTAADSLPVPVEENDSAYQPPTPVSNTLNMLSDGGEIITVADLGATGLRWTQTFSHKTGDRFITKRWVLSNLGSTTFTDLRFFHGGDTYFGNNDFSWSYFDSAKSMVYLKNQDFANWSIMGFYANPATPATHHLAGYFQKCWKQMMQSGLLDDTADASWQDAGYALQWNRASLAPGDTWTIEAFEVWAPAGVLQVLAPANQNALANTTVLLPFTVQNLGTAPLNLTLGATTGAGWTATVVGATSLTLGSLAFATINVSVTVPAGATGSSTVKLSATGNAIGSAASTLTVIDLGLTVTPSPLDFGVISPGSTVSREVTIQNIGGVPFTLGALSTAAPFAITLDHASGQTLASGESRTATLSFGSGAVGVASGALKIPITSPLLLARTVPLSGKVAVSTDSYLDDALESRVCVDTHTGDFKWMILSGALAGKSFSGKATVSVNGSLTTLIKSSEGAWLRLVIDNSAKTARGYFSSTSLGSRISSLNDRNTTDNPPFDCSANQTASVRIPVVPPIADVLFCFDLTSSMGEILGAAKLRAIDMMKQLNALGSNVEFGVVTFRDYPSFYTSYGYSSTYGNASGSDPDYPYRMNQAISGDMTAVSKAINVLTIGGGNDTAEAYTRPLFESYSDPSIAWRVGARKIIVNFGDAFPHDNNLNEGVPGKTGINSTGGDPGRDGVMFTADDLDLQTVLQNMNANHISLIACQTKGAYLEYWNYWAGLTGGLALNTDSTAVATDVVNQITKMLVAPSVTGLHLQAAPGYETWISSMDTYSGPTGVTVPLNYTFTIPPGATDGIHTFNISAVDSLGVTYLDIPISILVESGIIVTM